MKNIDPTVFDPEVFAASLEYQMLNQADLIGWIPVVVTTSVEYYFFKPEDEEEDSGVIDSRALHWQFDDFRPHYHRLRGYLDHWRFRIKARISEIRIWDETTEEPLILRPGTANWPSNGGPPILN